MLPVWLRAGYYQPPTDRGQDALDPGRSGNTKKCGLNVGVAYFEAV